jgi:hypothetical protein
MTMRLASITRTKILLIAAVWPVCLVVITILELVLAVRSTIRESGHGSWGLAAIGFGADPLLLLLLLGPSLGLVVAWAIARWIARRSAAA